MKFVGFFKSLLLLSCCVSVLCTSGDGKSAKRKRRCRCEKMILRDVSKIIDQRFRIFQQTMLSQGIFGEISSNTNVSNISENLTTNLEQIGFNVAEIKSALRQENQSLKKLNEHLNDQRSDLTGLRQNFDSLQNIVHNLTSVVDKLDKLLSTEGDGSSGGTSTDMHAIRRHNKFDPDYPIDCSEVYAEGGMKYKGDYYIMIKPIGVSKPFKVLCKVYNNSGWTVIQKRQNGIVDFYETWANYKNGFGVLEGEFWLGNDHIHKLTKQDTMLRVEMAEFNGKTHVAEYDFFKVESERKLYRLHIHGYHGNAGDSLTTKWKSHDGMAFSTKDRDNDARYYDNCAEHFHGAWWFNDCFTSHLNGRYYHKGSHKNYFKRDGILWNTVDHYSSLKSVQMMIRPSDRPRNSAGGVPTITNEV